MSYRKRKKTSWKDGGGSKGSKGMSKGGFESKTPEERLNEMREKVIREDALDARFGFVRFGVDESNKKLGWLMNMHPTLQPDSETGALKSCLDLYFIQEDGRTFKATVPHEPYFYVGVKNGALRDVEAILRRRLPRIGSLSYNSKEDLDLKNHLSGLQKKYLRVSFHTVQDLVAARAILAPIVARNQKKASGEVDVFEKKEENVVNAEQLIEDIREYDVPYYIRTAIDLEYRVGLWYEVSLVHGDVQLKRREDLITRGEPKVFAFDIETTKLPLKFPDAEVDSIMMISYMIDGEGFLITNRSVVSEDIEDFEFTPKPEFEGMFTVYNEPDEAALLRRFVSDIQTYRPNVFVTFNGDFFDWPFVEARAKAHGMDMRQLIGVYKDANDEYRCRFASHLDAFAWVKRDSYLPQGSQGLKAVAKAKLGFDPLEIDPELMVPYASERPQMMASYSVSDAVATYYLYQKYVHPFIYSLCTIIPMNPDDVLRKGSGTLCETLLMVEAFQANIIFPNKRTEPLDKTWNGHLLESETYIGGHVEAIESGVFRSDLPYKFNLCSDTCQEMIDQLPAVLQFAIEVENSLSMSHVTNYDDVYGAIKKLLEDLRDRPRRQETPLIYHLDVGAMYPNIILTNRLQPSAVVDAATCAACDHNRPDSSCQRVMDWVWRGDFSPANRNETAAIRSSLVYERFAPTVSAPSTSTGKSFYNKGKKTAGSSSSSSSSSSSKWSSSSKNSSDASTEDLVPFMQLPAKQQQSIFKKRLNEFTRKTYKKTHNVQSEKRTATVCMRENPFYVDTVRAFRDRRYEYKGSLKRWQGKLKEGLAENNLDTITDAKKMVVLFDSLQLAHKCILNSFYGYVMRKGSRWSSMEMAGIVTHTGAAIIKEARVFVEKVGRPLELDTDGIWCMLPNSFPENFEIRALIPPPEGKEDATPTPKKVVFSYPCVLLNQMVQQRFTNHQYQTLDPASGTYSTRAENSIFFEVDGPYKAMILPASTEEGKKLKKRYAVFFPDGSLAELKGFELKRRGELRLIKIFQAQVFEQFLKGTSLSECYQAVAQVANHWLDILYQKGEQMGDDELLDLISSSSVMSRALGEYNKQKSTALCTARRLAEFLGSQMVEKKGLACKFIISRQPNGAPVAERAIPVAIFSADTDRASHYLRKWTKDPRCSTNLRDIVDWDYYIDRLGGAVRKIITIPAALQNVKNPAPRVPHPDWLKRRIQRTQNTQRSLTDTFGKLMGGLVSTSKKDETPSSGTEVAILPTTSYSLQGSGKRKPATATGSSTLVSLEQQLVLLGKMPPEHEHDRWLKWMKTKWQIQRQLKRQKKEQLIRCLDQGRPVPRSLGLLRKGAGFGVGAYLDRQVSLVWQAPWHILQIIPTNRPGHLRVWALIHGQVYDLRVHVPRIFYVHADDGPTVDRLQCGKPVKCRIPRGGRREIEVLEVEMDEESYEANQKTLGALFSQPDIHAVYETNVPLVTRALLQLGCVCGLTPSARKARMADPNSSSFSFSLSELQRYGVAASHESEELHDYIADFSLKDTLYVYFSFAARMTRGLIGLFSPTGPDGSMEAVILVINGASVRSARQESERAIVRSLRRFGWTAKAEIRTFTDADAALSALQKELETLRNKIAPRLLMWQSTMDRASACRHISELERMVVVEVPGNQVDNMYPAIQWENQAAAYLVNRQRESSNWLVRQLLCARYAEVPIANLQTDHPVFLADIQFARLLKANNFLLWYSPSVRADVGQIEQDDNAVVAQLAFDDFVRPTICVPKAYRNITVELTVRNVAVNTILQLNSLTETDLAEDGASPLLPALEMVNKLVSHWLRDVGSGNSQYRSLVDMLIDHCFRWLSNPYSKFYDAALHHLLNLQMKKVYSRLVRRLRTLGAEVVSASFNHLIIATNKQTLSDARAYMDFVLGNIGEDNALEFVSFEIARMWEVFVFMDQHNYGGVVGSLGDKSSQKQQSSFLLPDERADGGGDLDDGVDVVAHWNIADYLPSRLQEFFLATIAQYCLSVFRFQKLATTRKKGAKSSSSDISGELDQLFHSVSQRMMGVLEALPSHRSCTNSLSLNSDDSSSSKEEWPPEHKIMAYHLGKKDFHWGLEFVKSVCHVLALDPESEQRVHVMHSQLLRMLNVPEYSAESMFTNPCPSYVLSDVMCTFCSSNCDLDLLRDPLLLAGKWRCRHCRHPYDTSAIQLRLVTTAQQLSMAYQLQDLACNKCRMVKAEDVAETCPACSGTFVLLQTRESIQESLHILETVAHYHKFDWLQQVTHFLQK